MAFTPLVVRDGSNNVQNIQALADLSGNLSPMHSLDSNGQVYRAAATFTPQATAAVTVLSIQGSASKAVRVRRVMIGGTSTANATVQFGLQRTSALGAGGTVVAPTIGKNDSQSATATAVVQHYTTTLKAAGTPVGGSLSQFNLYTSVVTTPTLAPALIMAFPEAGVTIGQGLILRGAADFIELQNLNAGNLSAATILTYVIEWVEDAS